MLRAGYNALVSVGVKKPHIQLNFWTSAGGWICFQYGKHPGFGHNVIAAVIAFTLVNVKGIAR